MLLVRISWYSVGSADPHKGYGSMNTERRKWHVFIQYAPCNTHFSATVFIPCISSIHNS